VRDSGNGLAVGEFEQQTALDAEGLKNPGLGGGDRAVDLLGWQSDKAQREFPEEGIGARRRF